MERRCWNGCDAEPFEIGNVFCSECYSRLQRTGRSKPAPSARAQPQPRAWSYEDIKAEFERNKEGL